MTHLIHIVGGGLAGSEAAWQAAEAGCQVVLHEMRPVRGTDAHQTDNLAELVCSNSLRSDDWENNAVGLLHEEMRRAGSLILLSADAHRLPAGGALAVDREGFSRAITDALDRHPRVTIRREEIAGLPSEEWGSTIIATGPLTSPQRSRTRSARSRTMKAFPPLRRHRTDRLSRVHRFRYLPDAVALRQGRRRRLWPTPVGRAAVQSVRRGAACGREDRFQGMGKDDVHFEGCLPIEAWPLAARTRCVSDR